MDDVHVISPNTRVVLSKAGAEKLCGLLNEKAGHTAFAASKRDGEWGVYVLDADGVATVRVHLDDIITEEV